MSSQDIKEQKFGLLIRYSRMFNSNLASDVSVSIFIITGFGLILFGVIAFVNKVDIYKYNLPIDSDRFSHFGDFAGGVIGTLWALIGILLIYKTLDFQKTEFKNLVKTADIQAKVLSEQQADNTFFNLLEHLQRLISDMDFPKENKDSSKPILVKGHDCFREIREEIESYMTEEITIDKCYKKLINTHPSDIPHYFSFFFRIIDYVENRDDSHRLSGEKIAKLDAGSDSDLKELSEKVSNYKRSHIEILRDQLSSHEIILLFYFYEAHQKPNYVPKDEISEPYSDDLLKYLKDYEMFKNISVRMVHENYRTRAEEYKNWDSKSNSN